jgi:hypothetical protein
MVGRSVLDVLRDVCDHLGWEQIVSVENEDDLTKDDRKLVRALNRVLRVMSSMNDWPGLRRQGEIVTDAEYTAGLLRLTNASKVVTGQLDDDGNPAVWTQDMVGRAIVVNGEQLIYRVADVVSATSLRLDREYQGDTTDGTDDAPDMPYHIMQDRYDLPLDFDRAVDEKWTGYQGSADFTLVITDANTVRARRRGRAPASTVTQPDIVVLWKNDEQNEHRQVVLDPFPKEQVVIQFDYQAIHPKVEKDTQRILFAPRHEEMIQSGVEWLLLSGPEDDARAQLALGEFLRNRGEDLAKQEIGQQRTRLNASQERALQQRTKWRRRGMRVNWGSAFDRKDFYNLD